MSQTSPRRDSGRLRAPQLGLASLGRVFLGALCLSPLHSAAQGNVLVVDAAGGPGSTHTTINGAVFAAADGDMVLIRAGIYDEQVFLNDGERSLVVAAEAGAKVEIERFTVLGLQPGKLVVLRGLEGISNSVVGGVSVSGCRGQVWVEDYRSDARLVSVPVSVADSDDVVLVRCRAEAGGGIRVERSGVVLFDCSATPSAPARHGLRIDAATVSVYGGSFTGSDGPNSIPPLCAPVGPGGDGVHVTGANSDVRLQDVQAVGGQGGIDMCTFQNGANGLAVRVQAGVLTSDATPARLASIGSPTRAGAAVTVSLAGEPSDLVVGFFSTDPMPARHLFALSGPIVLGFPVLRGFSTVLPPSGSAQLIFNAPASGGSDHMTFFFQAVFLGTTSNSVGSASVAIVLDPSL